MTARRIRLIFCLVLMLGAVAAARESAFVWFVGPAAVLAAACLLAGCRPPAPIPHTDRPFAGELQRVVDRYRRVRIAVARPIGRHPWITALVLFLVVAVGTSLSWRHGVPNLGVHAWHDCESNLLQARLIAEGRLERPALTHPEFFRTVHVLVTPIYCSKYPPGYPAVMALGLWAGRVEWVPPILVGLAVASAWLLGRRFMGRWPALLAALTLATCPVVVLLGSIQLSNTLCLLLGVLVLGLWADQIRRGPTRRRGLLIGLLLACMFMTRSFDALALGAVLAVAHFGVCGMRNPKSWSWIAAVCLGGLPGVIGLLAYHHATTGDWLESPYVIYERQQSYTGQFFHEALTPPPDLESLPVNVRRVAEEFTLPAQRAHTLSRLPLAVGERLAELSRELGNAMLLLPLAVLPVAWRCRAVRPMMGICVGYFGLYLVYAFNAPRYMAPILPALAWAMMGSLAGVRPRRSAAMLHILLLLLLATAACLTVVTVRSAQPHPATTRFARALATLPAGRTLVFVRYSPDHDKDREFVYNEPDLAAAERVFAHDLGAPRNATLITAHPDRRVFVYDEASGEMRPLPPS